MLNKRLLESSKALLTIPQLGVILKIILTLLFSFYLTNNLFSADLTGVLIDNDTDEAIGFAKIGLLSLPDSTVVGNTESAIDGSFTLQTEYKGKSLLTVRAPGFKSPMLVKNIDGKFSYGVIKLEKIDTEAETVLVQGKAATGQMVGDTVQFNSSAYKTNPDADAGDLIKKLPGIMDDGTGLKAQGEEVKRILVDGKEFFGNDPNAALKNIPAEAVQNVQIYDRNSDNAEFTGVDDGESEKTINLKLKEEYKSGAFGNIGAGYGTDDRYTSNGALNYFNHDMRLSFLGNFNNVNRVNFTSEDLSGVSQSSIGGGSGRRRYRYSAANEFITGGQEGITSTLASGINYIDEWTEDSEISMSYIFTDTDNQNLSTQNIDYIGPGVNGDELDNDQTSASDNLSHRLTARMRFPVDTNNTILFIPRFSWQNNESQSNQDGFYSSFDGLDDQFNANNNDNENTAMDFTGTLMLQHQFETKGRTIQADIQTRYRENQAINNFENRFGEDPTQIFRENTQVIDIDNSTQSYEIEIDYTEPLWFEDFLLTVEANTEYELSDLAQIATDRSSSNPIQLTNQSSDFDVAYNRYGWETGFRYGKENYTISVTGEYRRVDMDNNFSIPTPVEFTRTFEAFTPRVFLRYNSESFGNFRLFARRRNGLPSSSQLNDAIDNSNPLSIRQGNRLLDQEMDNYLWLNYNWFDPETSFNVFGYVNGSITENTIGNITQVFNRDTTIAGGVDAGAGSQYLTYGNLGNSMSVNTNWGLGKKIDFLSSNMNMSLNIGYRETPSIINDTDNINQTTDYGASIGLVSNISENVDFNFRYSPTYSTTSNTAGITPDNDYWRHGLNLNSTFLFWEGFVFRSDLSFTSLIGLGEGFDQTFTLWNASFGYRFLEKDVAEISLYMFDILGQNQSINRAVTETLIRDESNMVLTQYLTLNFSYRIRNTGSGDGEGFPGGSRRGR